MLASGSTGNTAFLATSKTRILIDAGLSVRELTRRLAEIGEKPEDIDAVLITHEHSDHVAGLSRFIRWRVKQAKPVTVFVSHLTTPMIDWEEDCPPAGVHRFQAGSGWIMGNIAVQSFTIPHDAVDPVGFCFHAEGVKIGIATDLGYVPDSIKVHLRRVQILLLESNHDLDMLKVGPLPVEREAARDGAQRASLERGNLRFRRKRSRPRRADSDPGASERAQQPSGNRAHGRGAIAVTPRTAAASCYRRTKESN